ncbi:rifamycin-inactivating phosphotransferase [Actinomarinicola tropica]|uniref:Phosphoenolpyruvate synthase n=1 Tax=Actinomarinicola tropica TaxID=2789776 RepID=A0A5Q2REW4_9ACTN|nr:rifamycin-inactivating phosphotransferase [Actinomarinicola tropica]QGG94213.1 phosphoenolpyruvate synthase [Actinomarinicola tropica]
MGDQRGVVALDEVGREDVALVGGKGAQLGELRRIEGVRVPDGVCVTTAAFRRAVAGSDRGQPVVPPEVADELAAALNRLGGTATRFAVRSSATSEDQPSASFAGQHDTFLGVEAASVADRVAACWSSLGTARAVAYRRNHDVDELGVTMAVVVQRMVDARVSGVLFTADPLSGHRRTCRVEAVEGLGDALVSGRVAPQAWTMRAGVVGARPSGAALLTDAELDELERAGRRIEAHAGGPQDVEWCLDDDGLWIVQSRPITTLFPVPETGDDGFHVYVSVGHQQMMTDAMTPFGLSVWRMTTPRPMEVAGSRLFVDVTPQLASPATRAPMLEMFGRSDPLLRDALEAVLERDELGSPPEQAPGGPPLPSGPPTPPDPDPAVVPELIARNRASVDQLRVDIAALSGPEVCACIRRDLDELRALLFAPDSSAVVMAAMEAAWWLNDRMEEWLGVRSAVDALTRSVPHNVTADMGLALLDVADAVRPHPAVVALLGALRGDEGEEVLDALAEVPGGREASGALRSWLEEYGVRCVGEIDITRPRWRETPGALAPLILGHVAAFAPGESARRWAEGLEEAARAERDLLARVRGLPDGEVKAAETEARIRLVRTFTGYREYPKFGMVSRYALYRDALLREVDRLVGDGALAARDDAWLLTFDELEEALRTGGVDRDVIAGRREAHAGHRTLSPPRVLTSDGEALHGSHRRTDAPADALLGLGVSAGVVEGRARVLLDIGDGIVEPGDVLVTRFTDPSWSPLFVSAGGLVTEVGGLMTHGAVVAREYGLPAIVGVDRATELVPDGAWVRLDGTRGTVEVVEGR